MDFFKTLNPENFSDDADRFQFALVYFGSIAMFFIWYYFAHHVLVRCFRLQVYIDLEFHQKSDFLSRITA